MSKLTVAVPDDAPVPLDDFVAPTAPTHAALSLYSPLVLRVYDKAVPWFSNRFIWRFPPGHLLGMYNRYTSSRHLEIGPGTGYFLDRCSFPTRAPELTLLDASPNPLAFCADRLSRYHPRLIQADITVPLALPPASFDSIALSHVLHCLPGPITEKVKVFPGIARLLAPGGILFGLTVLGRPDRKYGFARRAMAVYNSKGWFDNLDDDPDTIRTALEASFKSVDVHVTGAVAVFVART